MTNEKRTALPVFRLVAAAIVLGALAGAGAVYMKTSGSGNGVLQADADCGKADGLLARLKPLMKGQLAALVAADPPRSLGGFSFKGPDGKAMALSDFKGRTVLLNLWATWCIPCRTEMPELDALQKEMGADGKFEVAAINIDTGNDDKPNAFRKETGIASLAFYRDNTLGTFNRLKKEGLAFGLPATMLIDKNGCLVASMNGPAAWHSEDAKALIVAAKGE
jgi:thiol-disulfide isomerase/thioredoxin